MDKTLAPIIYPLDLDDEHYMIYNVVERRRPSYKNEGTTRVLRSIVLPVPSNLQVEYGVGYQNEGHFRLVLVLYFPELKGAGGDISSFVSEKIAASKDAFKNDTTDASVKAAMTAAAEEYAKASACLIKKVLKPSLFATTFFFYKMNNSAINPHMQLYFGFFRLQNTFIFL